MRQYCLDRKRFRCGNDDLSAWVDGNDGLPGVWEGVEEVPVSRAVKGRIKKKLSAHVESVVLLQRKDEQK